VRTMWTGGRTTGVSWTWWFWPERLGTVQSESAVFWLRLKVQCNTRFVAYTLAEVLTWEEERTTMVRPRFSSPTLERQWRRSGRCTWQEERIPRDEERTTVVRAWLLFPKSEPQPKFEKIRSRRCVRSTTESQTQIQCLWSVPKTSSRWLVRGWFELCAIRSRRISVHRTLWSHGDL